MKYIDSKKIIGITSEGGVCTYVLKPYFNESNPTLPFTFEATPMKKVNIFKIKSEQDSK